MKENKVCPMDTAPGEVIHMDQNGAVKFPVEYLPDVLERVKRIAAYDEKRQSAIQKTTDPQEIADIMKGIYK